MLHHGGRERRVRLSVGFRNEVWLQADEMIQIDINDDEAGVLREILASDLSELGYEIANTDSKDFRDVLKTRQDLLRRGLGQLPSA